MYRNDWRRENGLFSGEGEPGGGGGGGNPPDDGTTPKPTDWFEGLSDELKGEPILSGFKGKEIGELATGYRDLVKKAAESAPPATANDYGIELPASLAEAAKDPAVKEQLSSTLQGMLARAHALGLSKTQALAFVEYEAKISMEELTRSRTEAANAEKRLKEKWGGQFEEKKEFAARALETLSPELKTVIEKAGVGSHPHFIELIYTIGEAQGEGRLHRGEPGGEKKDLASRLYG